MSRSGRSILIVAYYGAPLLARALGALDDDEHVVVVDNSSDTGVREVVVAAGARYIDPGTNGGFAAGVNIGLSALSDCDRGPDDVLLLNPDARIGSNDIDLVQAVFDEPGNERVAAVSPRLIGPDGSEQRVAWPFPSPRAMWREALRVPGLRPTKFFVVGAVLLLRREALEDVGGFDERYFLYAEETDWQVRAAQRGWRSVVAEVTAEHVGAGTSASSRRRFELFHAGQETYIRRWFGAGGWQSYRLAVVIGAMARMLVGDRETRADAAQRARLYVRGPRAVARPPKRARGPRVVHVVVTDNAAGTERYVVEVAARQARAGMDVSVVGGNEKFMRDALPGSVRWLPGGSLTAAGWSLRRAGRHDVVHTHLTAADLLAVAMRPVHRGAIVSTRHIAKPRGANRFNQIVSATAERFIDQEIAISRFVAASIGRESRVVHSGVANSDHGHSDRSDRIVVMAQRLEPEKQTKDAVDAWRLSGLGERGWRLVVCGDGAERAELQRYQEREQITGVEWRGWVQDSQSVLASATALLATAPAEPLGLTVLEAMSLGLPIVATNGGGHRETVGACAGAMMFSPGDVEGCAARLRELAAMDAGALAGYSGALQALQRAEFDIESHVAKLNSIYALVSSPA